MISSVYSSNFYGINLAKLLTNAYHPSYSDSKKTIPHLLTVAGDAEAKS
jgi:hypothetical protein